MKTYDEEYLEKINESVDLLEYASREVEFQRKNDKDYFAHCLKHFDATPSLSINTEKNLFFCFSCGRGGGIIQWLKEMENLSFDEAVKKAAKLANMDIGKMCTSETMKYNKQLAKMMKKKERKIIEHEILPESVLDKYEKTEITQWEEEGISRKTLEEFEVMIDRSGNKIVYPVRNINGELINVKGRTLYADYKSRGLMKYMNYYKIGTMDYFQSLEKTLPYIEKTGEIKIFESIKSVMKLWDWGVKDTASAEKHVLTPEQIKIIIKLGVDVVFCYDSDVDYFREKKVRENIELLKRFTNVYIIEDKKGLLGGKDAKCSPADCGKEVWDELYKNRRRFI